MPRTKPRFNDLKEKMVAVLANGGNPRNSTDLELKKFSDWYLDPSSRTPLTASSVRNREGLVTVAVYPFALADDPGSSAATTMSKRSATWLGTQSGLKTASKIITSAPTISAAPARKGFYPAQAVVKEFSSSAQPQISKITGRRYKTKFAPTDKGYVIPFGTGADGVADIGSVQAGIVAAVTALSTFAVTFKPEEYSQPADPFVWS